MADSTPANPTAADPAAAWRGRRRRQDHGTKRDAVIRTAARAFDERGYHNTSLDDIAAALGVTKPTIYYYVANKEQLLFECFLAGLEPIRAALRRAEQTPGSGRDRLREVIRDYAVAIASEYGWCMVRAEHQDLGPELERAGALTQVRDRPRHPAICCRPASTTAPLPWPTRSSPRLRSQARSTGSRTGIAQAARSRRTKSPMPSCSSWSMALRRASRMPGKPVPAPARVRRTRSAAKA